MSGFWLKAVRTVLSRAARRGRKHSSGYRPSSRGVELEVLESRIAPAVTATFNPLSGLLSASGTGNDSIAFEISGGNVLVNNLNPTGGPVAVGLVKNVNVSGGAG